MLAVDVAQELGRLAGGGDRLEVVAHRRLEHVASPSSTSMRSPAAVVAVVAELVALDLDALAAVVAARVAEHAAVATRWSPIAAPGVTPLGGQGLRARVVARETSGPDTENALASMRSPGW